MIGLISFVCILSPFIISWIWQYICYYRSWHDEIKYVDAIIIDKKYEIKNIISINRFFHREYDQYWVIFNCRDKVRKFAVTQQFYDRVKIGAHGKLQYQFHTLVAFDEKNM